MSEVVEAVYDETAKPVRLAVGDKEIIIRPLKRRWQVLFRKATLAFYQPEMMATEEIQKAIENRTVDFKNMTEILFNSEIESDANLDEAAAIILASQVVGSEKAPVETVAAQREWLLDNSNTIEMRRLVEAQADKERLIDDVGERWPARLARSAHLAGDVAVTAASVKRLLTSSLQKLPATPAGDGTLTGPKPGGSSSDTSSATESKMESLAAEPVTSTI